MPAMKKASGFTLIELLIVIGIAVVLGGLAIAAVTSSLRNARVDQAIASIVEVSKRAQRLALELRPVVTRNGVDIYSSDIRYGVLIERVGSQYLVSLTRGGVQTPRTIYQQDGRPVMQRRLPSGVRIELANPTLTPPRRELALSTPTYLHWAYATGSGSICRSMTSEFPPGSGTQVTIWANCDVGTPVIIDGVQQNPPSGNQAFTVTLLGAVTPIYTLSPGTTASPGVVVTDGSATTQFEVAQAGAIKTTTLIVKK